MSGLVWDWPRNSGDDLPAAFASAPGNNSGAPVFYQARPYYGLVIGAHVARPSAIAYWSALR